MREVNVGVVGLGIQGSAHVEALSGLHNVKVIAVADLNFERAKEVARKYKVPKAYDSAYKLAEDPEVEAVIVATPDYAHLEPVMAALKEGKHVLVEKPMATRLKDAERMAAEAKRRGVLLMVNFENRFNPPFAYVKDLLDDGELGVPLHAYIRLSDTIYVPRKMLTWASKTSVAFFLMSHTVDLARWYFGGEVREVYSTSVSRVLRDLGTPDAYAAILKFEEGFALLESSWVIPETAPSIFDFKLELVCSDGAVYIDTQRESLTLCTTKAHAYPHLAKLFRLHGTPIGFLKEADRHFVECVAGRAEPIVKAEDGVANVRILEAIVRSSREGRPVRL